MGHLHDSISFRGAAEGGRRIDFYQPRLEICVKEYVVAI